MSDHKRLKLILTQMKEIQPAKKFSQQPRQIRCIGDPVISAERISTVNSFGTTPIAGHVAPEIIMKFRTKESEIEVGRHVGQSQDEEGQGLAEKQSFERLPASMEISGL